MTVFRSARGRLAVAVAALSVALGVAGAAQVAGPAAAAQASSACTATTSGPATVGRFGGIARPTSVGARCASTAGAGTYAPGGAPPLTFHGGPVMSTRSAGDQVVVTPIFWEPAGSSFTASYKSLINRYLADLAADSGRTTNVFATTYQYAGSNGAINYRMSLGTPISVTDALPAAGCTTNGGSIYADGSGYTTCLDDDQVTAETDSVVTAHGLARGYGHLYVMFLPQHVESCFYAGNPANQQCNINSTASSAFCAYHSSFTVNGASTVYATMPFPVYRSATHYSCTREDLSGSGTIQAPNGDADADVEISPLSHEMAEAITDPDLNAWYDAAGYENGDDCAYVYGTLSGAAGALYNQTVNGHHYLTQEEFSNADYRAGRDGCVQHMVPAVTSISPRYGAPSGGTRVTITGSAFPGTTSVRFGGTPASFTITDAWHLTATVPAGSVGTVDVTVTNAVGTGTAVPADHYTYLPRPKVKRLSPRSGTHRGGTLVTIRGRGFVKGATVLFGTKAGTSVKVRSSRKLTVRAPRHAHGKVHVYLVTAGGRSPSSASDRYRFR